MELYSMTAADLEANADLSKTVVLQALVSEGVLELGFAEEWAMTHTVLLRKKSIFRTLSDKWTNTKPASSPLMFVVKQVKELTNEQS